MGTIFNLCGLLCFIAVLGYRSTDSNLLSDNYQITNHQIFNNQQTIISHQNAKSTKQLLAIAKTQIGVRESTGNNDGKEVEKYLAYTGSKKGEPWCAAFVSWVFGQAGFKQPRTAWSPSLFPKSKLLAAPKPAVVFGIYFPEKGRIAHVGLVEQQAANWIYTIEGNTNLAGSREGDGVYRKLRHIRTIHSYASWQTKKGG